MLFRSVRRAQPLVAAQREQYLAQAQALKNAFGVRSQALDRLFSPDLVGVLACAPACALA